MLEEFFFLCFQSICFGYDILSIVDYYYKVIAIKNSLN